MTSKRRVSAKIQKAAASNNGAPQKTPPVRRIKHKRGGLESMPHMPLDILVEIMGFLMPVDMLHLARTSKSFRSFIMARSAAPLWRAARQNVEGLPDCPVDLSEPAYANLAFDTHCHECLQAGTKTILWALRVRYCPWCRTRNLKQCANHRASIFTESCYDLILPYTSDGTRKGHWHLTSEVLRMTEVFDALTKNELEELKQKNESIMAHAAQCERWQQSAVMSRQEELGEIRNRRLHAIVAKLRELGWDHELDKMAPDYEELRECSEVKQPKELTERSWNKIQNSMAGHMRGLRLKCEILAEHELLTAL